MRTAYGFLRDMDLARDVSQEAFVRVYGHLRRFDRSRPFATWLRRITVNLVIDELRRRRRRTEVPLEEGIVGADTPDPVTVAQTDESRHAVWDILEDMPLKYRLVMVLREIDGLPTDEIARIISRSEITVRWRLHYARKLFRERWVARFGEMEP
jgi:RNA polymerase sigma-70 factor (ECF subfamily)